MNGNAMSITLENERLKNEVYELRRLLSMQEHMIPANESSRDDVILQLHEDLDGVERFEALEKEIIHAKDALDGTRELCDAIFLTSVPRPAYFMRRHFVGLLEDTRLLSCSLCHVRDPIIEMYSFVFSAPPGPYSVSLFARPVSS